MRSFRPAMILPLLLAAECFGDSPFATRVVSYAPGSGASPGHRNPQSALGEPARDTGPASAPETVTPFQPPWRPDQVVSIGAGGSLVLELGQAAIDSPNNPFGIDLIVFSNAFFSDVSGGFGSPGICFGEGGFVDVSDDGSTWFEVPGVQADGPMPTMGYIDAGPFDHAPGALPTDFRKPMDPAIELADLQDLDFVDVVNAYGGSGGGAGIDLASVGLSQAHFVRIRQVTGATTSPEVDAVMVVRPVLFGDLDGNGVIDGGDVGLVLLDFGPCPGCPTDLDGSGEVDGGDVGLLLLDMGNEI
ncbi:MAG: hypothetical protein K8R92_10230 [Planctomycetes bacterium]|nr:hypothetical protein [Planctomycetota bacterium]